MRHLFDDDRVIYLLCGIGMITIAVLGATGCWPYTN